ncbi:hypothetical protein N1851_003002 [Merluccius polli]|uniref:Uncharacterized protein n=1 Tax=Merluccius polli TaxID=89951 RepID=A0AA47N933_MERPO|nr:hypothetical protein N1851_003002 [Merluccius polli]
MAPFRSASLMMAVSLTAVLLNACAQAAPAERGFPVKPLPFLSVSRAWEKRDSPNAASLQEEKAELSATDLSGSLRRRWLLLGSSPAAAATTGFTENTGAKAKATATAMATANGGLVRVPRGGRDEAAGPDKSVQMLRMISALEELYRTVNGTLRRRIAFMPRASGRNSAKKNKAGPATEAVARLTTAPPMVSGGTVSRASSTDDLLPSLSGRSYRQSMSPQPKKSNKRGARLCQTQMMIGGGGGGGGGLYDLLSTAMR